MERSTAPLEVLLNRLAAAGDSAPGYERLRLRLVTFFRLYAPVEAEALADEAIDRLARRLSEGTSVQNLAAYALGIARLIVMELGTRRRKERDAAREIHRLEDLTESGSGPEWENEPDLVLPALQSCLRALDPKSASLILEYYAEGSGAARITQRQRLAQRHGLAPNALRNRVLRLRMALEKCLRERLDGVPSRREQ
jgi:DNA-directed RNA polymerase specialized sigma24 family protein